MAGSRCARSLLPRPAPGARRHCSPTLGASRAAPEADPEMDGLEEEERDMLDALRDTICEVLDGARACTGSARERGREGSRAASRPGGRPTAAAACFALARTACVPLLTRPTLSLATSSSRPTAGGARSQVVNMAPPGRIPWEVLDADDEMPMVRCPPCCPPATCWPPQPPPCCCQRLRWLAAITQQANPPCVLRCAALRRSTGRPT